MLQWLEWLPAVLWLEVITVSAARHAQSDKTDYLGTLVRTLGAAPKVNIYPRVQHRLIASSLRRYRVILHRIGAFLRWGPTESGPLNDGMGRDFLRSSSWAPAPGERSTEGAAADRQGRYRCLPTTNGIYVLAGRSGARATYHPADRASRRCFLRGTQIRWGDA